VTTGIPRRARFFRFPWRSAKQIRADVDEELRFHLDMRIAALVAAGIPPDAARTQALREFGDLDDARQYIGAVDHDIEAAQRRTDFMNDLWTDIGYSLRKLRAAPLFTLAAVVTLALGIGANTAIFSVVHGVLLDPLPFPQADHIVRFRFTQQGHGDAGTPMDLVDNSTRTKSFVGISVIEGTTANLVRDNAEAERVLGVRVSANYFSLLRSTPAAGRYFATGEDQTGAANVAVISERLWKQDFSGDKSVIGKTVNINAASYKIIGVVPEAQIFPMTADIWMPKIWDPGDLSDQSRGARWLAFVGRVKDGVDVKVANNEVEKLSEATEKQFPEQFRERRARIVTLQDFVVGDVRKPLYIVLGAVALVLLIACANVANLLLVRATSRESEMAVRTALGASRTRLVRQLMTESVLLSLVGAAVGLLVAKLAMHELLGRAAQTLPRVDNVSIDGVTLAATAAVAVITGLIFGVAPAMQAGKHELATALRAGSRGTRTRPGANRAKQTIVVAEVALAVMLLTGAGLLLHSFVKLLDVDPGFRPDGVLSMKMTLPEQAYDSTAMRNLIQALETRMAALPGVKSAAIANFIPFDGSSYDFSLQVRGQTYARPSDQPDVQVREVTANFFSTIGIPIVRGRAITATDLASAPRVLVVNQAFAKKYFPNENPVGQALHLDWGKDPDGAMSEIVGVVGDVHGATLEDAPDPTVYASLAQYPYRTLTIVARTNGDPAALTVPMRNMIHELDHLLPVYSVQTMTERVAGSVGPQRFYASLIAIFASVALILAAVGLYGVIAYAVSQRTHELGVRVALGATGDRISRMVVGEGLALTAVGVVVGLVASIVGGRLVASLLFGVSAIDPLTLGSVVAVLAAVAALASWLPARRAGRVDPLVAMRGD
jgi:predicted permease